ncbi:MAG: UbiX family flavin prenyltransferase [Methanomicrobiales archaeon]|nr:UbiX family flavin prenyltransferase [Methanomicrobiales archaeon]
MSPRIVVGISGASGMLYARRLLDHLSGKAEVHLIITPVAREIARHEGIFFDDLDLIIHSSENLASPVASGSFLHDGMVIAPCSMKTLSSVSHGFTPNLLTRAADVTLKERRPLILLLRENPLSRIHMENMLRAHDAGSLIMTASPPFYHRPTDITGLVDAVIARILDHLNIEHSIGCRWSGYS